MSSFKTTVWETIEAARGGETRAVEVFVRRYRAPLLEFLRLQGCSSSDAEDLSQEVFLRLFSRELLEQVDPARGRFRSYLLAITRNVLSEQRRRDSAQKRGGGEWTRVVLSEVVASVEDPGFDACWCRDLLQKALDLLKVESPRQFEVLELRLMMNLPYAEIAERLGKPVEHVRVDLHRAKQRMIKQIRREIAAYSSSQEEFDEELALFLSALEKKQ